MNCLVQYYMFLKDQQIKTYKKNPSNQCSGLPCGLVVITPPANVGDAGLIPGWRRSSGGGNSNPLQYSCLENPMDRAPQGATVHRVTKSQTQLSAQADMHTRFFQQSYAVEPQSWTIKKTECQRNDAFKLWCWIRLLKSPLDCKEIKTSQS